MANPAPKNLDPIKDVAAAVLADDHELRARVHALVDSLLSSAEYTIRWGTPKERNDLMKMIVPPLLRSLQKADVSGGDDAQAQAYARLLESIGGTAKPPAP